MEIGAELAKKGAEECIYKIISELRYICCYTCIVDDFGKEKERLEAELKTVEQRNQEEKRKGKIILANVSLWEKEAEVLIKEDTKTNPTCFPGCISRYRRGRELANKTEEIKSLVTSVKTLPTVGVSPEHPGVERNSSQYYISFKDRESKTTELLEALKDDKIYLTGLQGMGGAGKTTLATEVGKQLKLLKQFDHVILTTVSSSPNIKQIQDQIVAPLGLQLEKCTESERRGKLWSRLTDGEKILLILDDVWANAVVNFDEIGIPSIDNCKGCRVLITSRDMRVCKKLGCEKVIKLGLLSEEDAWIMFKSYAGLTDSSSKPLLKKGREIAKECKRLPVAIAVIAKSLKGQELQVEWNKALKSLQEPPFSMDDVDESSVEIFKCLKISFDNMKLEMDKGLFLLFSAFPEDMRVPNEILTRLCIGAGIVGKVGDKYDDARMEVVLAINRLIGSCLLLKDIEGYLTMHDLVREAAHWIANKEIQEVNMSSKKQKSLVERENNIKYLSCKGKCRDVFSCRIVGSKLEILNIYIDKDEDNSVQVQSSFFENMKRLRILNIDGDGSFDNMRTLSLLQSIQSLMNLRSIIFYHLDLEDISFLGNLQSLETLEFFHCYIESSPRIGKMEKLRLLGLTRCFINFPYDVIERCSSLEELYIIKPRGFFDNIGGESLTTPLQRYYISDSDYCDYMYSPCSPSNKVFVFLSDLPDLSEEIVKFFVKTAEDLRLRVETWQWENFIPEIVPLDEGMNNLLELHISSFGQLQYLIDTTSVDAQLHNVFSKLAQVQLEKMDNLKELCNGPYPSDFLKSLEKLQISQSQHLQDILFKDMLNLCNLNTLDLRGCPTLESLFQLSTARSLVSMEKLSIHECSQLKNIIVGETKTEECGEEIVCGDTDNKSHDLMFPKLKTLEVRNCPQLQVILPFVSPRDVPLLEKVVISVCDELKHIFGEYKHEHEGKDLYQEVKNEEIVCGDTDNKSHDLMFPKLKTLEVSNCPQLQVILPFVSPRDVPLLEKVGISVCDELKYIFREYQHEHESKDLYQEVNNVVLGSLKELDIKEVPNFIDIFPECDHPICSSVKRSSSKNGSQAQIQLDPMKCNFFPWRLWSNTTTKIPLVPNSSDLQFPEYIPCLLKQLQILHTIKEITLYKVSKINSVFILSSARTMLLESLFIVKCDELKDIITCNGNCGGINRGDVFPKLRELSVGDCGQLEYMFGHSHDHQNDKDIVHLHLPALETLALEILSNFLGICSANYQTSLPPLKVFVFNQCPKYSINSVGDFHDQLELTHVKDPRGNKEYILRLENVLVYGSNAQNIFCLDEMIGQQMTLQLKMIELKEFPQMMNLFVGPKNFFILRNLTSMKIIQCEKLETIFSTSTVRSLPQLCALLVSECRELKQIIEEDAEDRKISKTCFPKLKILVVASCNKLKCVFPVSFCKELPKLEILVITVADELEEVFGGGGAQKVVFPKAMFAAFIELPSLCLQGNPFETVQICPELIVTSTMLDHKAVQRYLNHIESEFREGWPLRDLYNVIKPMIQLRDDSNIGDICAGNTTAEITSEFQDFPIEGEVQENSLQGNTDESIQANQAESNQNENGTESNKFIFVETKTKPGANQEFVQNVPNLELPLIAISSTDPEQNSSSCSSPLNHQTHPHGMNKSVEEGTTPVTVRTITPSSHLEVASSSSNQFGAAEHKSYAQKDDDGQIITSFLAANTLPESATKDVNGAVSHQEAIQPTNDPEQSAKKDVDVKDSEENDETDELDVDVEYSKENSNTYESDHSAVKDVDVEGTQENTKTDESVSLHDDAFMKVSSIVKDQLSISDDMRVLVSMPSPILASPVSSQSPSMPSEGNTSQVLVDLSFGSLVSNDLEKLVSKKHLASENLSLLVDFLVKHPSVRLAESSLSNRYKGYAYSCLAELLKFLQTHSVMNVLGSSHAEFVELLQDVRKFAFDKDWLDGVERRALISGSHVSEEALQNLLESKRVMSQHVEDLKHQLACSKAVLERITQQEAQVLEARAALTSPLGY